MRFSFCGVEIVFPISKTRQVLIMKSLKCQLPHLLGVLNYDYAKNNTPFHVKMSTNIRNSTWLLNGWYDCSKMQ